MCMNAMDIVRRSVSGPRGPRKSIGSIHHPKSCGIVGSATPPRTMCSRGRGARAAQQTRHLAAERVPMAVVAVLSLLLLLLLVEDEMPQHRIPTPPAR